MSDFNNYGDEGKPLENNVCNYERLPTPDSYVEYDVHLCNRLIQTTNSLLYDGSCSICSTPDYAAETDHKNLSLPNLFGSESTAPKTEETNLSCEDCNIMEEPLPYPTHLSLYEIKQKDLSNSMTMLGNTHRYDDSTMLNTDEQTDIDSCDRYSEPEFMEASLNKRDGDTKNVFCEEIGNLLDPSSLTLHLLSKDKSTDNEDVCLTDSSKLNSASDVGTSFCSTLDHSQSCDIASSEASNTSSKCSGNFNQNSKTLSRYEIMKQRKLAKNQRKHFKDSLEACLHKDDEGQTSSKSIEQLVSFIEGKDSVIGNEHLNETKSLRNNHSTATLGGCKRHNIKKKKKKSNPLNNLETVSNSEPTSFDAFENCVVSSSLDDKISPCARDSTESMCHIQTDELGVASIKCEPVSDNRTSSSWMEISLLEENKFETSIFSETPSSPSDPSNLQKLENVVNCSSDVVHKVRQDVIKKNLIEAITSWSEASRCDVVDGFPEIMSIHLGDKDINRLSNYNSNQCNHNEIAKASKKFKVNAHKLNAIGPDKQLGEDDDKMTEFSYSTNTNSSADELSSKESELEEFVIVQKKKKIRMHERTLKSFQGKGKTFPEKKGKPEVISNFETGVGIGFKNRKVFNGIGYVQKTSESSIMDLLTNIDDTSLQARRISHFSQLSINPKSDVNADSLTSSNATSPDDALSKKALSDKFKYLRPDVDHSICDYHRSGGSKPSLLKANIPIPRKSNIDENNQAAASSHDEAVFFDTRNLNRLEKSKCVESSDISFIFEEHSKNIIVSPKRLPEVNRFNVELEHTSRVHNGNYFGDGNSNVDCLPVDISTSCSSEEGLNVTEKDKGSQCTSLEILNCDLQPNILVLPKQTYADDLMLPLPYLPFASAPPFGSYPLGFTSSAECVVDQGQAMPPDTEQLLSTSPFQLQPSLPIISPMYTPYNCYVAVIPSLDHEASFLPNHSDIDFCGLTCMGNENEVVPDFSNFPYHRKLDETFESESLPPEDGKGLPGDDLNMEYDSKNLIDQDDVNHVLAAQNNASHNKFKGSCKERRRQTFVTSKENKNLDSDKFNINLGSQDLPKEDFSSNKVVNQSYKKTTSRNSFNVMMAKNGHQHHSQERTTARRDQKDGRFYECDHVNGSQESKNDLELRVVCSAEKISPKNLFNLERAQIYLLNLFEASRSEENCSFYCGE